MLITRKRTWILFLIIAGTIPALAQDKIPYVRTPDERFTDLPDYPFAPHYITLKNGLRMHYVDEGTGPVVLCLHGEPSWSYLYRKIIPVLAEKHRVIAPDLLGFGRSDKPTRPEDFTYELNYDALVELIEQLKLTDITLVCHDWGGLLGLPLAMEHPDWFARLVIMNTDLPTGDIDFNRLQDEKESLRRRQNMLTFLAWRAWAAQQKDVNVGDILEKGTARDLSPEIRAAYDAPFPDATYKVGVLKFPSLVPIRKDDPLAPRMVATRQALATWQKPALVLFSNLDPITAGAQEEFRALIPSAKDEPADIVKDASHFLQEDKGEEVARHIRDFLERRPLKTGTSPGSGADQSP